MRLGQMARKLGVSQAEIVRYLSSQNLEVADGSNVKLDESRIRSLYSRYAPGEQYAPAKSTVTGRDDDQPVVVASESILPAPELPEETSILTSDLIAQGSDTAAEEAPPVPYAPDSGLLPMAETTPTVPLPAEQSDTIRAPKIELAGLKVVGKIDLPEPRKKETQITEDAAKPDGPVSDESRTPSEEPKTRVDRREEGRRNRGEGRGQDDRRRSRNNPVREQRPYQNPIAAQREREIEDERERQKKKAAEDKERRTQNYQKRVKHSPPTKAARIVEEPVEEMDAETLGAKPASWFGKFLKWLKN